MQSKLLTQPMLHCYSITPRYSVHVLWWFNQLWTCQLLYQRVYAIRRILTVVATRLLSTFCAISSSDRVSSSSFLLRATSSCCRDVFLEGGGGS